MEYFKITQDLVIELKPKLEEVFPNRQCHIELNHWHDNRYIQLPTVIANDTEIHYELYRGYVEFHLEGKYGDYEYNPLWRALVNGSEEYDSIAWHRWSNRNQGRCRYEYAVQNIEDILKGFKYLSSIFDPMLQKLIKEDCQTPISVSQLMDLPIADPLQVKQLTYKTLFIKDIPFKDLVIPEYQRPYKWSVKNVNQLINDLIVFTNSKEYRLGTLVLNGNNIVDGQQRMVTLALILYVLFTKSEILSENPYQEFQEQLNIFLRRTHFKNAHSIAHVRENIKCIRERTEDLDYKLLNFILLKCQFVVVQLPEISEAFQFFDSQNARGKDLEPHDLLKAFHLREMRELSTKDSENITLWQDQDSPRLMDLFLSLFRVKKWSKSRSGREFTKNNIDTFKGISLDDDRYNYYMPYIICHYFSNLYSSDPSRKIDKSVMEFPYQLDQICINGSRFFDMIRHYGVLYEKLLQSKTFSEYDNDKDSKSAYKIVYFLNHYRNRHRKGDIYVRQFFNCLLIYYVDRFGYHEINKVVKKLFRYVYGLRLTHFSIQLSTIDNEAVWGDMFRTIRDGQTPYDVMNLFVEEVKKEDLARNVDQEMKEFYY